MEWVIGETYLQPQNYFLRGDRGGKKNRARFSFFQEREIKFLSCLLDKGTQQARRRVFVRGHGMDACMHEGGVMQ